MNILSWLWRYCTTCETILLMTFRNSPWIPSSLGSICEFTDDVSGFPLGHIFIGKCGTHRDTPNVVTNSLRIPCKKPKTKEQYVGRCPPSGCTTLRRTVQYVIYHSRNVVPTPSTRPILLFIHTVPVLQKTRHVHYRVRPSICVYGNITCLSRKSHKVLNTKCTLWVKCRFMRVRKTAQGDHWLRHVRPSVRMELYNHWTDFH
jgi:hypothetical protein